MTEEQLARKRAYQREWGRKNRAANPEKARAAALASHARNREKRLAYARAWKARNKDRVREYRNRYWKDNRAREMDNRKRWARENPERIKEFDREDRARNGRARYQRYKPKLAQRARERYQQDERYALMCRLRASLTQALRRAGVKKTESVFTLISCSIQDLVRHLERQFLPGMTWENRSAWHVDHIRPVARFDLRLEAQRIACFHWSNLQPLWGRDNQRKGCR